MKNVPRRGPGRPSLPVSERRRRIGFSLSPATIEQLSELARLRGQSQAHVLQILVDRAFRRERKKADSA